MQGKPSVFHLPFTVRAPHPVTDHLVRILVVYEQSVAVHEICAALLKLPDHLTDGIRGIQEIITVQQPDDISGCCPDALVDPLIHPLVRFRDDPADPVFVLVDHLQRAVFAGSVHYDIFNFWIILGQHAFNGLPDGCFTVEA